MNDNVVTSTTEKVIHILLGSRKRSEGHTNIIENYMVGKLTSCGFEINNHFKIDELDGTSKFIIFSFELTLKRHISKIIGCRNPKS